MKLLLIRPKIHRLPSVLNFVNVEPLELEYLAAICKEEDADYDIYDGSIEWKDLRKQYRFADYKAVVMSGYINSIDKIKSDAAYIKRISPGTNVVVGGVMAELVPELFYSPDIDVIVHSGGLETFRRLIRFNFDKSLCNTMNGICYSDRGSWHRNPLETFHVEDLPIPDRKHFNENHKRFHYLHYKSVALIKTAYSCPYKCNFCCCRNLNGGIYTSMKPDQMIREIKAVEHKNIWIVDDIFLINRRQAEAFADRIKKEQIEKNFIIYSRADFIAENRDLLPALKKAGVEMVIVGLEASDNGDLKSYEKNTDEEINRKCVEYLKESGIKCTGLFIANTDFSRNDFRHLRKWIKEVSPDLYTLSIFTPLPGTEIYETYKPDIITFNYKKYDFLHLIRTPANLGKKSFYFEVYKLYIPFIGIACRKLLKRLIKKLIRTPLK